MLSVDGSSNKKGSGVGVILEGPGGVLVEQSLCFNFQTSNNQAEYEALLAKIRLTKEVGARVLTIKSNSQQDKREDSLARRGFSFPLLKSLGEDEVEKAIKEAHEGAYESHIGGRALVSKNAWAGFYWPTIKRHIIAFIKKCDKC
ncbi:hypothetical protein CR513_05404, partial [Mucuna pruriens]